MQGRHIGEVQGRNRHVLRPVIHVPGCIAKKGLEAVTTDKPHAVLMRNAADAGDLGIQGCLIASKDSDGHLVDAKAKLAAF
jgi:hypothetical protein